MNIVSIIVERMFYILVGMVGIIFFSQSYAADACTMEYAPVCGSVQVQCIMAPCNPVKQTFSNSCMARSAHATDITQWACDEAVVVGGDRDSHGCIGSAGYIWSEVSHSCIRPWENTKKSPREALKSGTWNIDSLNGKKITASGTITFDKKTFSAKLCNMMSGQYGTISNVLIFRKTIATRMYCDGDIMAVEDAMNFTRAQFLVGESTLVIKTRKWDIISFKK